MLRVHGTPRLAAILLTLLKSGCDDKRMLPLLLFAYFLFSLLINILLLLIIFFILLFFFSLFFSFRFSHFALLPLLLLVTVTLSSFVCALTVDT